MGKFNEYSQKATPADNDTLMIYDATSKANKLSPFSGIWNWIVEKLTNAVISNLQTNNKSVVGALNELNSKPLFSNISDITIEVSNTDDDPVELAFPIDTEFLYVSYGIKNSVQSYGGATLIIDVKEVKPCFVPVYRGANVEGYLYLYPNPGTHKLKIYGINLQTTMLVKVKGR